MADNDTSSGVSVTQPSDLPVMGTPASQGVTPEVKQATTTLEEALARIAELERSHKNAREAEDRLGKKLLAYEKAEQEKKDAELSELERAKKQHAETQSERDVLKAELQEARVHQAVERYANKLNFVVPAEMLMKLIERTDIEYENGRPTNVEKLLEQIAKTAPDLVKKQPTQEPETPPARGNAPALPAMNPGRSTIVAPNTVPPGKPIKLSDVPWSR